MKNKDYWNLRAKKNKQTIKSTTNFNLIKEFEISILKYLFEKYLKKKSLKILELGCGNGVNLKSLKTIFPKFEFYGIDYSKEMVKHAKKNNNNINFIEADITKTNIYNELPKFDVIFTNRCLINLKSKNKINLAISKSEYLLKKYIDSLNPKLVIIEVFPGTIVIDGIESSLDLLANDYMDWNKAWRGHRLR